MEVVVSTAVLSIVMVAIGSAILVASRAMPGERNVNDSALRTQQKLDFIASELCWALQVAELTSTSIEFTIPDRKGDGDSLAETIRYAWSGVAGDPITRQYNGGTDAVFLDSVHHAAVEYDRKVVIGDGTSESEGPEQLLVSHPEDTGGTITHRIVEPFQWPGQFLRPPLPPEATGWRPTRVRFQAQQAGPGDGMSAVLVRTADGDCNPTATTLAQVVLDEDDDLTSSYAWREIAISGAPVLAPEQGICLVLAHAGGGPSAWVRYESGGQDTPDCHSIHSSNQGGSWVHESALDMVFQLYGTVRSTDAPVRYYLQAVRIVLQVGPDPAGRASTSVRVHNQPEVPAP
jgi:hypothetical protein